MSHLITKQDNEMIFEKQEHNRFLYALVSSRIIAVMAIVLAIMTIVAWSSLGRMLGVSFLVIEGLMLLFAGGAILRFYPVVAHRRRIRDAIGGLVNVLNHQLSKLEFGDSMAFGTNGLVYYNVMRRGMGSWHVQVFSVGADITEPPIFEAVIMKYRMTKVDDAGVAIRYTPDVLALVNSITKVVAGQCEGTALVQLMGSKTRKQSSIDEIEQYANRQS